MDFYNAYIKPKPDENGKINCSDEASVNSINFDAIHSLGGGKFQNKSKS